jgi:hypothetical protein
MLRHCSLCLLLMLTCADAMAHKPSDSYLTIRVENERIFGQWDIALRDLDYAIGLDANDDGQISWGELRTRGEALAAYVTPRLRLGTGSGDCGYRIDRLLVDHHSDGAYAALRFAADCSGISDGLTVEYSLFFDLDPQHRGLLRLEHPGQTDSAVFGPDNPAQRFNLGANDPWKPFRQFFSEGVWHIWIGFDHILFLLSLLLPSVLIQSGRGWEGAKAFRPAFWDVLTIVTAFSVAHSCTLTLAVLDFVALPSRWVESAIAASVILAAANNLHPFFKGRRWMLAFGFGLVHGLGFASVLLDLGLDGETLVIGLVSFNLGVEAGQLAIVSAFMPLAYALRRSWFYRRLIFPFGSLSIAAMATVWLLQRSLLWRMPGF